MNKDCEFDLDDRTTALYDWYWDESSAGIKYIEIENITIHTNVDGFVYETTCAFNETFISEVHLKIRQKLYAEEVA